MKNASEQKETSVLTNISHYCHSTDALAATNVVCTLEYLQYKMSNRANGIRFMCFYFEIKSNVVYGFLLVV